MANEIPPALVTRTCISAMLATLEANENELGLLDAAAGDGDHGAGMVRGMRAAWFAVNELPPDVPPGELLATAASTFADAAGGASGALVGALLGTIADTLGDDACDARGMAESLAAGLAMVCALGKAQPGDKTLIDTLDPFVREFAAGADAGKSLKEAWLGALPAAGTGAQSTAAMIGRRGRSSRLGERSVGHLDPGAVSMFCLLEAVGTVL